jgi:threonine dehydrogenase-like Zn-dependent dehydrogenase
MTEFDIPATQHAVRLAGPGRIELDPRKPVDRPGPRQILLKVEAVCLCFSDLKLLAQFSSHPRKAPVVAGIEPGVLEALPSYVPGELPTVPGHEVSCTVVAVGDGVTSCRPGDRALVQPDFRAMRTPESNGAFGYNFEGGLQEYVLLDERVVVDAAGPAPYLLAADAALGRSAVALVEPWACVENSYRTAERQGPLPDGRLLVLAYEPERFDLAQGLYPKGQGPSHANLIQVSDDVAAMLGMIRTKPDAFYDDVIVFGAHPDALEAISDKLAAHGVCNVVLEGERLARPVEIGIGRVHYAYTRWVGTSGDDPADGYRMIPADGEARPGARALVAGAGGPMGQMHVLRALGRAPSQVVATDVVPARLESLARKAPQGAPLCLHDARIGPAEGPFDYVAIMAPVPELAALGISQAGEGGVVNLFAGIPAGVKHPIDLDLAIRKRVFFFGTSGSETADVAAVYRKLKDGELNTGLSVDAVCGITAAIDGLRAVRERSVAGKIVVYPQLKALPLTPLSQLSGSFPSVAERLDRGAWTREAEDELLRVAG